MRKLLNFILDFVFPQFCLECGQEGSIFCKKCKQQLKLIELNKNPWNNYCHLHFDACYVCMDYDGPIAKLIHKYKYSYLENISDILVEILYKQLININIAGRFVITNIPLHPSKKRQRGFDQAELLAKKLSQKTNTSYVELLKRIKKTKTQAKLSKTQRIKNTKNSFIINNMVQIPKNNTIILIDDVTTTGFTLAEAAKTLKEKGFNKIVCLVLAKN